MPQEHHLIMAPLLETVVASGLIGFIVFLIIPIICYYLHIYYAHRSSPIIHKRHYKIMIVFNILLMISLLGDKSLYMVSIILTDTVEEAESHIIYKISDYVYFFVGPAVVLTMGLAAWMFYYDTTWTLVTNPNNKWTHFVDPKFNDNQSDLFVNNWFIKNRSTFGNTQWLIKHILCPLCVVVYITLFLSLFIAHNVHYVFFMSWMAIIAIFIGIIVWKLPQQNVEIFKIKSQISRMVRIELSFVICFAPYVVLRLFVPSEYQYAVIFPFQYVFAVIYLLGAIIPTRYVLMECGLLDDNTATSTVIKVKHMVANSMDTLMVKNSTVKNSAEQPLSLANILKEKLSFQSFMTHLLREFSSENLLAILECFQFKMMVSDMNEQSQDRVHLVLDEGVAKYSVPCDGMPQSVIVYDDEHTVAEKAARLIEKYVFSRRGMCDFEVNISSQCRCKIMQQSQQLNELTMQQMYALFDQIILQLIQLLNDSHLRFIRTESYKQLQIHGSKSSLIRQTSP
eukprot:373331_1